MINNRSLLDRHIDRSEAAALCSAMSTINAKPFLGEADYFTVLEALDLPKDDYIRPERPVTQLAWRAYDAANLALVAVWGAQQPADTVWSLAASMILTGEVQ